MESKNITDMNYIEIVEFLSNDDCLESRKIAILRDIKIKEKIICQNFKVFSYFCEKLPYKYLDILLDEEGIKLLESDNHLYIKLSYIFVNYSDISSLFEREEFCKLLYSHVSHFFSMFDDVDFSSVIIFLNFVSKINELDFQRIFLELGRKIQSYVVQYIEIPDKILKSLILLGDKGVSEYLLDNDFRIKTLLEFSFDSIYKIATKGVRISSHLLREPRFVQSLSTMRNVKDYRMLMNSLAIGNDVSFIEQMRKKYYENEINNYDEELDMLGVYADCYREVIKLENGCGNKLSLILNERLSNNLVLNNDGEIYKLFNIYALNHNLDELVRALQKESHLQLTNMIIDYTFEDIPYNVFLDLKQLISFQKGEGRQLTDEEIEIYSKVIKLDELNYKEARTLHERLKKYSLETIYDHFRNAKNKVASLISKVMLNEETIQKFRNEKLSEQHGVDVYVLDGAEFYALVSSFDVSKCQALVKEAIFMGKDGYSFTLDHSSKLSTYRNPNGWYNIVYSFFPEDQLVHIFPVDSYSLYIRDNSEHRNASKRIFELNTPEELIKKSKEYNEIVLSLPNENKTDELNSFLLKPEKLGIYCFDEITPNDVISAKNFGIGIVLVKTMIYSKDNSENLTEKSINYYDELLCGRYAEQYNYFCNISDDDMKLRRLK